MPSLSHGHEHEIALSRAVYGEMVDVLSRPKFARLITPGRATELLGFLSAASVWFEPVERVNDCRDAFDNIYLELALAARATAIVSGDQDLLVLDPWRGVRILQPTDFLQASVF